MEFNEIKKVWTSQSAEPLYAFDLAALHSRILVKKKQISHIAGVSEALLIAANTIAGLFILAINLFGGSGHIAMYALSVWMLGCAFFMVLLRMKRIKGQGRFDRTMTGDLGYALSMATYQVRISSLGRWSILPIGILTLAGLWEGEKSYWLMVAVLLGLFIVNWASRWEHRIYQRKKREFEVLKQKLEQE